MTSDWLSALEAKQLGMVNQVVPTADLLPAAIAMAQKIASKSTFAVKAVKEAVNHAQDVMGRRNAMMHAFGLHHLSHSNNKQQWGTLFDVRGVHPTVREKVNVRFDLPASDESGD